MSLDSSVEREGWCYVSRRVEGPKKQKLTSLYNGQRKRYKVGPLQGRSLIITTNMVKLK